MKLDHLGEALITTTAFTVLGLVIFGGAFWRGAVSVRPGLSSIVGPCLAPSGTMQQSAPCAEDAPMRIFTRLLLAAMLSLPLSLSAQVPAAKPLPEEAARRLQHIIGEWDSRWEWVWPDGSPRGIEEGTEIARYLIGERVVELTTRIEGEANPSKAWMFYGENDGKFHLVSVSATGDLWKMHGDLDRFVITSEPHPNPDGSTSIIRFTHHDIDHDHLRADMELSRDGGATWTLGFRQYLTRRGAKLLDPGTLKNSSETTDQGP
jgi:hypothetical protein